MLPSKRQRNERPGHVYLLGSECGKILKVGHTDKGVRARIDQHVKQGRFYGTNPQFLGAVSAVATDEGRLLRMLAEYQIEKPKGSWKSAEEPEYEKEMFHAGEPVRGYIRWLRKQWFFYRSIEDSETFCEWISSDRWMFDKSTYVERRGSLDSMEARWTAWGDVLIDPKITGDDYYTNEDIIRAAHEVIGRDCFDFDPATHPYANRVVCALDYCTIEEDGLSVQWPGDVWLNPPFNQWGAWSSKILTELQRDRNRSVFVLCPTRSLTSSAVISLVWDADAVCFTDGRFTFWGEVAGASPDDGHVIFYFGPLTERFRSVFSKRIGPTK